MSLSGKRLWRACSRNARVQMGSNPCSRRRGAATGTFTRRSSNSAHTFCADGGRLVALVPGAWSSDLGTAPLRRMYLRHLAVERWTSFENLRGYFPIDGRYKFGVLVASRAATGTVAFKTRGFAADAADLRGPHVSVSANDLERSAVAPHPARPRVIHGTGHHAQYLTNGYPLFDLRTPGRRQLRT